MGAKRRDTDGQTAISLTRAVAFGYECGQAGAKGAVANSSCVSAGERFWLTPLSGYRFSMLTA